MFALRLSSTAALLILSVFVSGCGLTQDQRSAVVDYAKSSSAFGETSKAQLVTLRQDEIETNTRILVLSPGRSILPRLAPVPGRGPGRQPELDGSLTPSVVKSLIVAVAVVQNYGDTLQKLMLDSHEAEVKAASGKLVASLKALRSEGDFRGVNDAQLDAVGKAVELAGLQWIEYNKARAIKRIVPAVHPAIAEIGVHIATLFGSEGSLYGTVLNSNRQARRAALLILSSTRYSITDRKYAGEVNRLAFERDEAIKQTFPKVADAARKMSKAHEGLVQALEKGDLSIEDIKEYRRTVEELISIIVVFAPRLPGVSS